MKIRTASGEWRIAHSIGVDVSSDIALLRFDGSPLPSIPIANALPRQGQDVMVIGSPYGYGFSVGTGVVARYGKDAAVFSSNDFMLVTAATSYGSSGGFVVNTRGEAISLVSYGSSGYTQTI
ncbi:MAG: serine protease, partial [Methylotenera sp.]|nr:serine protease [Methylotenera sp.]